MRDGGKKRRLEGVKVTGRPEGCRVRRHREGRFTEIGTDSSKLCGEVVQFVPRVVQMGAGEKENKAAVNGLHNSTRQTRRSIGLDSTAMA